MPHSTPLIATIVVGLALAFVLGVLAHRVRVPPLVGYLLAGVLVGPFTPGFVADQPLATELAEIGVILLMFGVGLHFSLADLWSVRLIAIPGAVVQIAVATVLGLGFALTLGWSTPAGLVFGLALSVASTVVLLRALQERRVVETERGRIAVGWLIVEDLAMVLALVLLPALGSLLTGSAPAGDGSLGPANVFTALGITLGKVVAFIAFMLVVGRRLIPWALYHVAGTGSRELFRLAVLVIALGVAFMAAKLFSVSFALGAFFAGMIMSESELSHRAGEESLPLRDAFAVLFFVSVGMLFDPMIVLRAPLQVLGTLFIIVVGKSIAAFLIVIAFRHSIATALTISASLAQIGEFSFILAGLGVDLALLPERGRDLILAGAILSILMNPLVFVAVDALKPRLERWNRRPGPAPSHTVEAVAWPDGAPPPVPTHHVIVVGYGRVGSIVGEHLRAQREDLVVIEADELLTTRLRSGGVRAVAGNAARPEVLRTANVADARLLLVAIPNCFEAAGAIEQARRMNPPLRIVARAHSDAEAEHLSRRGADVVIMGEREIARRMIDLLTSN